MNRSLRAMCALVLMAASMPVLLAAVQTVGSSDSDTQASLEKIVEQYVADINKGDVKTIVDKCSPHTAVVDGFPPYAWDTCAD